MGGGLCDWHAGVSKTRENKIQLHKIVSVSAGEMIHSAALMWPFQGRIIIITGGIEYDDKELLFWSVMTLLENKKCDFLNKW